MKSFQKDPDDTLDYTVDWTDWLQGDTIDTSSFLADTGITINSNTNDTTSATVWLSGGSAGETYRITNRITTAGGRTRDRSFGIFCTER